MQQIGLAALANLSSGCTAADFQMKGKECECSHIEITSVFGGAVACRSPAPGSAPSGVGTVAW
jgi:hypothetical protein